MEPIKTFTSRIVALPIENIDTDQIIPARYLKTTDKAGLGESLFADWRYAADGSPNPDFVLNREDVRGAQVLVAGNNFGCGSSREHAPWALEDYGFRAVVAPSFADIFYSNCTKIGLLPVVLPEDEVKALMGAGEAEIDLERQVVAFDGRDVPFEIDAEVKRRLLGGLDDIGVTLQQVDAIELYEAEREREGPVTTSL
jgi:3-isopropylmalate/(R)-2-methylmalate dehydratase small subunit